MIKEIEIPNNCDFIIEDNRIIIKEKKEKIIPRTWKEFCKNYPVKKDEYCIKEPGYTLKAETNFETRNCATWCTSKKEAEAFLALIKLRQLRKAWVGDWKQTKGNKVAGIFYSISEDKIIAYSSELFWSNVILSFPSLDMANEFLDCFKDLCEIAKELL